MRLWFLGGFGGNCGRTCECGQELMHLCTVTAVNFSRYITKLSTDDWYTQIPPLQQTAAGKNIFALIWMSRVGGMSFNCKYKVTC